MLLKDIATVKGGKRLPKTDELVTYKTDHPYIRIRDMYQSYPLELNSSFEYITNETHEKIKRYIVNQGDVIVAVVGNTIGLVSLIGESLDGANLTENCNKLVELKNYDNRFLYYFLTSKQGQEEIKKGIIGSSQPKLPIYNIEKFEVPDIPLGTQVKIVSLLESIDKKIDANEKINRNLEAQAQTIFKEWFIDNADNSSWEVGTFSDLVVSTLGGDWGKEEETGNYTEQVYCIRGADIPDVKAGNKGKMPTRFILPKNFASKQLVAGDIVVEISGGSPTQSTGRVASVSQSLLDRYDKGMVCTNFCRALKPKAGYSMFIYYYWQYLYDKGIFFLYENGTTGIKNLDINGFIDKEEIVLPPKELIDKFDDFCQSIFDQIFKNGISTEKLSETRDALLPKLMSGELDVSDINL